jgi:hypothetical protein
MPGMSIEKERRKLRRGLWAGIATGVAYIAAWQFALWYFGYRK